MSLYRWLRPTLQRLEARVRDAAMRLFADAMPTRRPLEPVRWGEHAHRVLYLRYDRIGDMIMATGLIRAIASSHPTIQLDILASPSNAMILHHNPHVHEVLTLDRRSARSFVKTCFALRRRRYDAVIDGMVLKPSMTMLLLMLATGARYRIGIGGRENDFGYTLPVEPAPADAHQIIQSAATATPFGLSLEETDWRPELFYSDAELAAAERSWIEAAGGGKGPRLLVNIAAGEPRRRWPADRVIEAIRRARVAVPELRALVIAPPSEIAEATRIASAAGAAALAPVLREALALVARSDAVFTPDTSIAHAASAARRPSVVMMIGGSNIFEPFRTPGRFLYSPGPTLESLETEPVARALEQVVRMAAGSRR